MGNEKSSDQILIPPGCKLYSTMSLTSPHEEQYIRQILTKRSTFFLNQHICTASGYQFLEVQSNKISCEESKSLAIFYDSFDYLLSDIPIHKYNFSENDICGLIYCITDALKFLKSNKYHHGDISLSNICKRGNFWKLIDKTFIKNGVTAYQRVLQGEEGFISPEQMERIRYGFVRESPPISETDDIFGLGMVVLQLGSQEYSSRCYKESFIRFNEESIEKHFGIMNRKYSKELSSVVKGMLHPDEESRLKLDDIINHPAVRRNNKYSLKSRQEHRQSSNSRVSLRESNVSTLISTKNNVPYSNSLHKRNYQQKYSFQ